MKNKKVFKYYLKSLVEIILSALLTGITVLIIKMILNFAISFLKYPYWNIIRDIRYSSFGQFSEYIIVLFIFVMFYWILTNKRVKSLLSIIEETEIMANGDLDRVIEVKGERDIKELGDNINSISKQLRDITISERNAQNTKSELITNVSHDLRTPLTSIMGYLELIDSDQYKSEVELRYYINIAYEKSKGLSLLINDLFELTKMQNSTINLKKEKINLVDLLGQVVAGFEYQFKHAGMESRVNFSEDKLLVEADGEKLVRAFENLLSNSIKYGKDGYYVDIKTKVEDKMAIIQIINYGETISSIHLPYIFDRFYRIEKSRNSNEGGSGLGLAITKNIIELHMGTIDVYSDDYSTIFRVKLPIYF